MNRAARLASGGSTALVGYLILCGIHSTVLYAKTHGFHWNVTGPMFNTLHLMFMEQ